MRSGTVGRAAYPSKAVARRIAHLDIDAFYASVELLRRPELRGLPVIVSGSGPRSVVTTASYEARKFGVGSAMPTAKAMRLCPEAVIIPPDFEAYRAASKVVMGLVRGAVEQVEVVGLDEAYLDLSDLFSPKTEMRRLVAQIKEASGLNASVGIGPNKLVAKVASDAEKPTGFVVLSREQAIARFAGARVGLVPGIGPKTAERLHELGITTLGELARTSDEVLANRFGANQGPWLARRGRFEDDSRVSEERIAVSESRERTFDVDVADHPGDGGSPAAHVARAVLGSDQAGPTGTHHRDQGPPRRLDHRDPGTHDPRVHRRGRSRRGNRRGAAARLRAATSCPAARRPDGRFRP